MSLTNEEKLELAKKCGAKVVYEGAQHTIFFESQLDFFAYTSAIEEKYQAQIAMLKEALKEVTDIAIGCTEDCPCKQRKALSATQATADAFVAEVKAGAKLEGKIEALEKAMSNPKFADAWWVREELRKMIAELRNSAAQLDGE